MQATRFSPCVASRLAGLALAVFLGGLAGRGAGGPLPPDGKEEFQRALLRTRAPASDETAADELADRRRELRDAAGRLPSLGDVARVLLLSEWGTTDLADMETPVPIEKVEAAVRRPSDEDFKKDVQALMKAAADSAPDVAALVAAEIKREVRLGLLERLELRIRFYLHGGRAADRIAVANLISETMASSRRQDNAELTGAATPSRRASTLGARFLRQRLRELAPDLRQLTGDADPQVQVAAVRALSDLEGDTAVVVSALRPLLTSGQTRVVVRRAAARGLAHMAEIAYLELDKSRPEPTLKALTDVFPAAAGAIGDDDAEVRRGALAACQRAVSTFDELVGDRKVPEASLPRYRPMARVVQKALPDLNRAARDPDPTLRVAACHLLETLVLLSQKVRLIEEGPLTPSKVEPGREPTKGAPLPPPKGARKRTTRPDWWAVARPEAAPAAALGRPVKAAAPSAVRPASFVAPAVDELPAPARLEGQLKGTVEAMIEGLGDADYRVRLASLDVLESFGDRAAPAIPALTKALSDRNKFVRWAAARTLGHLADRARERHEADEVVQALARLLNDREDISVRITAAYALELYGPSARGAVPHLARVINRGDKEYIVAILHTLQGIGTDAKPALANVAWVMRDRSQPTSVRVEAARTLGRFGALATDQLADLREVMVNDPNEEVRHAAGDAVLSVDRPEK